MTDIYYLTIIYPDGSVSGPTPLFNVDNSLKANRVLKQKEKLYPNCQVFINKS